MATSIVDFIFRALGMEYMGRTDFVQVKPNEDDFAAKVKQKDVKPKPATPPPIVAAMIAPEAATQGKLQVVTNASGAAVINISEAIHAGMATSNLRQSATASGVT